MDANEAARQILLADDWTDGCIIVQGYQLLFPDGQTLYVCKDHFTPEVLHVVDGTPDIKYVETHMSCDTTLPDDVEEHSMWAICMKDTCNKTLVYYDGECRCNLLQMYLGKSEQKEAQAEPAENID